MMSLTLEEKRERCAHEIEFLDEKTAVLKMYVDVPGLIEMLKRPDGWKFETTNTEIADGLHAQAIDPSTEESLRSNILSLLAHCGRL